MRRELPPDRVTLPPPSRTSRCVLFRTLAVCDSVMVIGLAPQLKVITPPAVTAASTAAEVQPAGVPVPMTWSGRLTFSNPMPAGTGARPVGLPGLKVAPDALLTVEPAAAG